MNTRNHKQPQEQQQEPAQEHLAKQVGTGHGNTDTNNTNNTQQEKTMTTEFQMIPLSKLFLSKLNVRKSGNGDVSGLAASIKANDVLQNLVVTPEKKGKREGFGVVAGGRRLEALEQLVTAGDVDTDKLILCKVVDKAEAVEISTAENVLRDAMHPADEFEAFDALIRKGRTAEQVAARFGTTVRKVEQRMKLARVSPKIIEAYREGELTLDVVEAFTLTDDHKKQEAILKACKSRGRLYEHGVRSALTEETVREHDRRVRYVGDEAYVAAGGVVTSDLFTNARYYANPEILDALTAAKLDKKAAKLAKDFAWIQVEAKADWQTRNAYCEVPKIDGEASPEVAAQLVTLRARVAELDAACEGEDEEAAEAAWDQLQEARKALSELEDTIKVPHPDGAALTGAVVMLMDSGKVETLRGVMRKADRSKLSKGDNQAQGEEATGDAGDPNAVRIDLSAFATGVAQVAAASNVPVALRLLAFQLARSVVRTAYSSVIEVRASVQGSLTYNSTTLQDSPTAAALDALDEQWEAVLPEEDDELLTWCLNADDATVNGLLAYVTARTINGVQNFPGTERTVAPILAALSVDMKQHWTPNAAYFSKLKKRATLAILAEHGHTGPELAKMKRDQLAARAAELLQGTGWLPPTLR